MGGLLSPARLQIACDSMDKEGEGGDLVQDERTVRCVPPYRIILDDDSAVV